MIIRFSTPKRGLLFFLWGCLIWSGCSAILPLEIELDEARIAEIEVYGKQMKEQSE